MATKNNIFDEQKKEYFKADKQRKGEILTHVCFVTRMHRKAVIRRFRVLQCHDPALPEKRGRSVFYTPDVVAALKDIWKAGDEVCAELLHPMIPEYLETLQRDCLWKHSHETTDKLVFMSLATTKRIVNEFLKARKRRHGIGSTKPSHIKHLVPIFVGPWHDRPPGFGQADTVMHNQSAFGDCVYTVNITDAATMGVFPRAQWNKGMEATMQSLNVLAECMANDYVPLLGIHPDTGSEFINRFVMQWSKEHTIELSRSRPNHKNDNMYVEERNGHVIRKHVGYLSLTHHALVDALNAYYEILTPYLFHFVAVRRMTKKERVGSRYVRTYEAVPQTPYQRTLAHPAVDSTTKEKVRVRHAKLNPLLLKREMEKRIKQVYDLHHMTRLPE